MASLRPVRRMLCSAAEAAAAPASTSRWERLKNSKAGEGQRRRDVKELHCLDVIFSGRAGFSQAIS